MKGFLGSVLFIGLLIFFPKPDGFWLDMGFLLGVMFIVVMIIMWIMMSSMTRKDRRINAVRLAANDAGRSKAAKLVEQHMETLARKYAALTRTDEYGVVNEEAWQKEWSRFMNRVVAPILLPAEKQEMASWSTLLVGEIEKQARAIDALNAAPTNLTPALSLRRRRSRHELGLHAFGPHACRIDGRRASDSA